MKFEISMTDSGWKCGATALMQKKKSFALTEWDFLQHSQDCTALARQFDYTYIIDRNGREVLFSPKDRIRT